MILEIADENGNLVDRINRLDIQGITPYHLEFALRTADVGRRQKAIWWRAQDPWSCREPIK